MSANLIANTPRSAVHALGFQGIMVTDCYPQIRDMLRRQKDLGDDYVLLFAEPQPNQADSSIDWYSPVQGAVQPLSSLPEEEQNEVRDRMRRMGQAISDYARELGGSPDSTKRTRGEILELALKYPGEKYLYMVGGQPVCTCWGFGPGTPGAEPQSLTRLARLAITQPAPKEVEADPPPEEEDELLQDEPPAPPPPEKPQKRGCLALIPWFLLWLLALLLLMLLLLLPFVGFYGLPAWSGYTLFNSPWPKVPAMSLDKGALEGEVAALRAQLRQYVEQCVAAKETEEPMAPTAAAEIPVAKEPEAPVTEEPAPEEPAPEEPAPPALAAGEPLPEGPKMVLPEDASDMAFLQGHWRCDTGLIDTGSQKPIVVEFRFDEKGQGMVTLSKGQGQDLCKGTAEARMEQDELQIMVSPQSCESGDQFSGQKINCKNKGNAAQCFGVNLSKIGAPWDAQFVKIPE